VNALLAPLWRAVAQHAPVEEAAPYLFALLREAAPQLRGILLRRWDGQRLHLETVALAGGLSDHLVARSPAPSPRRDEFLEWSAQKTPQRWHYREQSSLSRFLVPEGIDGPVAAAPLGDGPAGVLVLVGNSEGLPLPELAEAMTTALANDQRLHELSRLREAAEQDRAALLSRLDRQDVSEAIIGAEAGLLQVMERVRQVAPTDAPVLILGETGAGKEVVARTVHARSRRSGAPFLRVNCGAIPTELVDSELFGHEKGSFTGAISQRKGWFERADGGTLFLDEIGELPAAAQVRLLRVLQDGSIQRVGGQESHTVDVRIVAATHRDMAAMVRDRSFREDLWYRISVFPIPLPSLRQRRNDIPALAIHFAERAGQRLYGRPLRPSPADLELLCTYDWPGNVRELAAVIERATILGSGHGLELRTALGVMPQTHPDGPSDRATIEAALRTAKGRVEGPFGAAAALGVNPHTLRSRMRRLGIAWDRFRSPS
jgi:hydrogenase-4 transcriptional activator